MTDPVHDGAASGSAPVMGSSILRQAVHTIGVRSLTLVFRFALVVLMTKTLSAADFGAYSLVSTIGAFGVVLCGLNLFTYVYRSVPGLPVERQLRILKTTLSFEVMTTVAVVILVVASGQLPAMLRLLNAEGYGQVFLLGLVVLIPLIVTAELTHFFQAQARNDRANWVDFLAQAAWVIPVLAAWAAGVHLTLTTLLAAQIAGGVAVVLFAARHIDWRAWWRMPFDSHIVRMGLAFSVPLIVPTISVNSARFADRLILSHYGSVSDVGVYSFAAVFLNSLYSFTGGIIGGTFGPRIFAAHNQGDVARRDMLQTYMLKTAFLSFVLPFGVMCLAAKPFVALLARPEYAGAAALIPLLGLGPVMLIIGYPASFLLTLQNRVFLLAAIDVVGTAVALTAYFLLIPRYSYFGAAAGGVLGLATTAALQYAFSGMSSRIRPELIFSLSEEIALFRRCIRRVRAAIA